MFVMSKDIVKTRKRLILFIFCFVHALPIFSQWQQVVYIESFGASTTVGAHYDFRFNSCTHWGMRVGIGYSYSDNRDFLECKADHTRGITFPLAVNYLAFEGDHHLELGIGFNFGLYTQQDYTSGGYHVESSADGVFGFVDIGYRYQTRKGLLLRIGLNPSIPIRDEQESVKRWYGVNRSTIVYPYIGVGYAF